MNTGKKCHWNKVTPVGNVLGATNNRYGCSATLVGHFIWVIGGYRFEKCFSVLDVKNKAWRSLLVENDTLLFRLHDASLYQDQILLAWAKRKHTSPAITEPLQEVLTFDPVMNELHIKPTCGSSRPRYSESHTINICENEQFLVLFGGRANEFRQSEQLHLLDLTTWRWRQPKVIGQAPSTRQDHGSWIVGSWFYVYTGDALNAGFPDLFTVKITKQKPLVWHRIPVGGDYKDERMGAGLKYVGNARIVVFGGHCLSRSTDELFVIENINTTKPICHDVLPSAEHGYSYIGTKPSPRQLARLVLSGDKLIVLGGRTEDGCSYFELSAI